MKKNIIKLISSIVFGMSLLTIPVSAFAQINQDQIQKIFSLGRSFGTSYYYFTDLSDKAQSKPYSDIKKEYLNTFQSLNIIDIITNDIGINADSQVMLDKLKTDFYNSLQKQDLKENCIPDIKNNYILSYENTAKIVQNKFGSEGSWILALGFYTSFQKESLDSHLDSKLLLSGFHKILASNPLILPEPLLNNLMSIDNLDKTDLKENEIKCLKDNIVKITEYFGSYPENTPIATEITNIKGTWKGILVDPENQMHKIKLNVSENLAAKMDIDGIAQNILISDVKIINNYSTFMFKPFGSAKLYIKFNAKLSNNMLAGEAVDNIGQKGNWVLSKLNAQN